MGIVKNWFQNSVEQNAKMKVKIGKVENSLDSIIEYFDCPICRCALENPMQTSCGHVFCRDCLSQLTTSRATSPVFCPLCKKKILTRGFIERSDVEDMRAFAMKLSDMFKKELKDFVKGSANIDKGRKGPESLPITAARRGSLQKKPTSQKENMGTAMTKTDKVKIADNTKTGVKSSRVVASNIGKTLVPLEDPLRTKKGIVRKSPLKPDDKAKTTSHAPSVKDPAGLKPKDLSNHEYIVVTASAIPEPLDLTTSRRKCDYQYKFTSAIKFIKPLDLSVNKEKRKFEEEIEEIVISPADVNKKRRLNEPPLYQKRQLKTVVKNKTQQLHRASVDIEVVELEANSNNGGKITSSDELFRSIPEETISKYNNQTSEALKKPYFKEPPAKTNPVQRKHKDARFQTSFLETSVASDDDFDRPTDSDAVFANLSDSIFISKKAAAASSIICISPPEKNKTGDSDFKKGILAKRVDKNPGVEKERLTTQTETRTGKSKEVFVEISDGQAIAEDNSGFDDDDDNWLEEICTPAGNNFFTKSLTTSTAPVTDKAAKTPSVEKDQQQRYVFCYSRLDKVQTQKLHELSTLCNGSVSREFTPEVTHLIITLSNGRVAQTLKYLLAIAGRKWVVIFDWVEKCIEKGKIIPEETFETSNFKQSDPGVKLARLSPTNLFDGFNFHISSNVAFKNQYGFTLDEVKMLITTLGAQVIDSPETFNGSLIIIGNPHENDTEYYSWFTTRKWITIIFQYIIDCILEYKLKPVQKKYLCINVPEKDLQSVNIPKSLLG